MKKSIVGPTIISTVSPLVIFLLNFFVFGASPQQDNSSSAVDSSRKTWTRPFEITNPSPGQLLQLRALQNSFKIQTEMTLDNRRPAVSPLVDFSQMFHEYDQAYFNYPGIEYRHGSNYIPQNVRDYTEFKMGRDRYLPVFNPVLIGFILYNVSKYANYYFGEKDTKSILEKLDSQQKKMLQILQFEYPLNLNDWYRVYQDTFHDSSMTISTFTDKMKELDQLSLVKTRVFEKDEVKYYPALKESDEEAEKKFQFSK